MDKIKLNNNNGLLVIKKIKLHKINNIQQNGGKYGAEQAQVDRGAEKMDSDLINMFNTLSKYD